MTSHQPHPSNLIEEERDEEEEEEERLMMPAPKGLRRQTKLLEIADDDDGDADEAKKRCPAAEATMAAPAEAAE